MNETARQKSTVTEIIIGMILFVLIFGGGAVLVVPKIKTKLSVLATPIPDVPSGVVYPECRYAWAAANVLVDAGQMFADVQSHVEDPVVLKDVSARLGELARTFGRRQAPEGMSDLQIWTVGAVVAAQGIVDAFSRGDDGVSSAEIYLALSQAVGDEINRFRAVYGCW